MKELIWVMKIFTFITLGMRFIRKYTWIESMRTACIWVMVYVIILTAIEILNKNKGE